MCGAFNESSSSETDQAGLLQSTHGSSDLCAWVPLAATARDWLTGNSGAGAFGLVDHPWQKSESKAVGRKQTLTKRGETMGQEGHPHLGSWLCWQSVDNVGTGSWSTFYRT